MAPRLLTGLEMADALGCSIRTVERMAARGELRQITIGQRLRRYAASDLAALADPTHAASAASTPRSPAERADAPARAAD
jgi:excisionase family DNA binding protein